MARPPATPAWPTTVVAFAPRDRGRAQLRVALPRRRARLVVARTMATFDAALRAELVDAAVVHLGAGDDAWAVAALAPGVPSVPFWAVVSPVPGEADALQRARDVGVADVLVDGIDDAAIADLIEAHGFTARFARALAEAPAALGLTSPLQRAVWRQVVGRGGRPVATTALAAQAGITREHLSRSFAAGGAPTLKRVIDLVRLCAAAELAKNPAFDSNDVARVLGFASSSHLTTTAQRVVDARAASLARLRTVDLVERFAARRAT